MAHKETMAMSERTRAIRMGMVGGGRDAFIGGVHRMAAALDGSMTLVAGALSSTPEKAIASGGDLGLDEDRCYGTWEDMLAGELARSEDDRIEVVVIVTPNHVHFPVAKASLEAGFHVVCDKPMVCTAAEADALVMAKETSGCVFAVTYNYTGYPMVKQMRSLVRSGAIGSVRKVMVEYLQGWLATPLEQTGHKQAAWRNDPAKAGVGGAMGDIGSHAENLVSYVTGLGISGVTADVTTHVPDRVLDDDVSVLLTFDNGATGILTASQICPGSRNGLRLRVWGETGGVDWQQEMPNQLLQTSPDGPDIVHRTADLGLCDAATEASRLPGGHSEGFIEAFANIYRSVADAIHAGHDDGGGFDYPDVHDGARGVRFIERVVGQGNS
jgi:predicted dehydrogenase|tara:strand:- start:1985 stop:3136 length:1152 start_codon:yes stop_codon:yes gene_type:complete